MTQKCLEYDGNAFVDFIVSYDKWHLHNKSKSFQYHRLSGLHCSIHQTELSSLFALHSTSLPLPLTHSLSCRRFNNIFGA